MSCTGIQWLGFALTEAVVAYGLIGGLLVRPHLSRCCPAPRIDEPTRRRSRQRADRGRPKPQSIWTLICFGYRVLGALRKFAFGPIQKTIDERRDRLCAIGEEADDAVTRRVSCSSRTVQSSAQARNELAENPPRPARGRRGAALARQGGGRGGALTAPGGHPQADRSRETVRAINQKDPVADLTIEATQRVIGRVLDNEDHARARSRGPSRGSEGSALERGRN